LELQYEEPLSSFAFNFNLRRYTSAKPRSDDFYLRAVIGSANYKTGGDLNDFFHGWLNYQIEHHMARPLTIHHTPHYLPLSPQSHTAVFTSPTTVSTISQCCLHCSYLCLHYLPPLFTSFTAVSTISYPVLSPRFPPLSPPLSHYYRLETDLVSTPTWCGPCAAFPDISMQSYQKAQPRIQVGRCSLTLPNQC